MYYGYFTWERSASVPVLNCVSVSVYRDHYRESQLNCLGDIQLQYIHSTLELFLTWIKDGMYNFNHVPYTLKTDLREEVVKAIPPHYQGMQSNLIWYGFRSVIYMNTSR